MKANELRILNWVKYPNWSRDNTETYFMVRELYFDNDKIGITNGLILTETDPINIKPIPLTEEILLKAGFVYDRVGKYFTHNLTDSGIYFVPNAEFRIYGDFDECVHIKMPEYLHELQNLVYILTGNELEVKL